MKIYLKDYVTLSNHERLAYVKVGTGSKVLVLIHGNYSSLLHWSLLIEALEKDYTIYAMDLRGFGDSSYEHEYDSLEELADDVYDFCNKLDIKEAAVAGWSLGGGVAMYLAAKHQELVKYLFLVDSMSYRGYPMFASNLFGKPMVGVTFDSKKEMANDPYQVQPIVRAIRTKQFGLTEIAWNAIICTGDNYPPRKDYQIYIQEALKQRCVVDALWALMTLNLSDIPTFYSFGNGLAKNVICPVTSFWGEKDKMVPLQMATENCVGFKQLEFVVIKGSGHAPILDNTELIATKIKERY